MSLFDEKLFVAHYRTKERKGQKGGKKTVRIEILEGLEQRTNVQEYFFVRHIFIVELKKHQL